MSAREALQAAVVAALRGSAALDGVAVFDAPPVRASVPFVLIEEPVLADASAKALVAREGRFAVIIEDRGERPVRLRGLSAAIEAAVLAMAPSIGDGWRVLGVKLARERIVRGTGARWLATSEFAVRLYRDA